MSPWQPMAYCYGGHAFDGKWEVGGKQQGRRGSLKQAMSQFGKGYALHNMVHALNFNFSGVLVFVGAGGVVPNVVINLFFYQTANSLLN